MTLTERAFEGKDFFRTIRAEMDKNRGMFAGQNGALRYVCLDANFYRFEVLIRPDNKTFTDAAREAVEADPSIRAIANGQYMHSYNYPGTGLGRVDWQGEVISGGKKPREGDPPSKFLYRHFGQWNGCSLLSFAINISDPSYVTPTYNTALGTLLPLVEKGVRGTPGQLGNYWSFAADKGKPVYGLSQSAEVVFLLVQEDGEDGLTVPDLIDRLISMGVDNAVIADGSDSVTLVVDSKVEVEPGWIKNRSIPVGPMFRLHSFDLTGKRSMSNFASDDPEFQESLVVEETEGNIHLTTTGMNLKITSLGTPTGVMSDTELIDRLGVTLPVTLKAPTSLLTATSPGPYVRFSGGTNPLFPNPLAFLTLKPEADSDGKIIGAITFTTSRGIVEFKVDWPVGDGPVGPVQ